MTTNVLGALLRIIIFWLEIIISEEIHRDRIIITDERLSSIIVFE